MDHTDLGRFALFMSKIGDLYRCRITESVTELYWSALKDYDFVYVESAFKNHVSDPESGRHRPLPADLIRRIPKKDSKLIEYDTSISDQHYVNLMLSKYGNLVKDSLMKAFGDKVEFN